MDLLEWDEKYSVGHEELDTQHKEWLRIMNELHASLVSIDDQALEQVTTEALLAVIEYAETHFQFEEKLMEDAGYEDLEYHRKIHTHFHGKMNRLYDQHVGGQIVLNSQLMKTLQSWLIEHILSEDKKAGRWINSVLV